ncbi:mevalonate kinase [Suttonella sp. R2A3]|uniref:mevalonate kinase family protein n=1 Tax=Suttonella sp. R2A3 TaxID=2908648 RepID=UPI001F19C32E|nr:mevalonate kinase [Suttonella sp. R2A3]UJF23639.1 mevalonate kinase [Suttonella sp. R2A3]
MIQSSAPGSIMLSGEHAVVYGHQAIVCAIEQRIHVTLSANEDNCVRIDSALGQYEAPCDHLKPDPRLRFVLACIERYPHSGGVNIQIDSEIDPTLGLGSSAAVTIATLGALARHTANPETPLLIHEQALTIIRSLQGRGSGADCAASLYGGLISYRYLPQTEITALPTPPCDVFLRYAGYKTPTAEVLAHIAACMADDPDKYESLYEQMGECTDTAIKAANDADWPAYYAALNHYQSLMVELGVSDSTLGTIIDKARQHPDCHVAKISGSGLGDCVVALSETAPAHFTATPIANQGLMINERA